MPLVWQQPQYKPPEPKPPMMYLRNERGRLVKVEEPRAKQLLATGAYVEAREGEPVYDPTFDKSVPKPPPKASTPSPVPKKPAAKKATTKAKTTTL